MRKILVTLFLSLALFSTSCAWWNEVDAEATPVVVYRDYYGYGYC